MAAQIFECAADKIAHVDQRRLGEIVKPLHGALGCAAGRGGDMREPGGARDIDAALDRVDPGAAGIGDDDAGRPKHRQPAEDAEPRIHRFLGEAVAAGDRDRHLEIGRGGAVRLGELRQRLGDDRPRRRVDRGLADREREAGTGHGANPLAGAEMDT